MLKLWSENSWSWSSRRTSAIIFCIKYDPASPKLGNKVITLCFCTVISEIQPSTHVAALRIIFITCIQQESFLSCCHERENISSDAKLVYAPRGHEKLFNVYEEMRNFKMSRRLTFLSLSGLVLEYRWRMWLKSFTFGHHRDFKGVSLRHNNVNVL